MRGRPGKRGVRGAHAGRVEGDRRGLVEEGLGELRLNALCYTGGNDMHVVAEDIPGEQRALGLPDRCG